MKQHYLQNWLVLVGHVKLHNLFLHKKHKGVLGHLFFYLYFSFKKFIVEYLYTNGRKEIYKY